ncbi:MAG: alpha-glucan family phosphorylase [Anaerolineae bacterium]|nr:alpha-glucan family phosphorylase [Anaerolineae bacterium]
MVKPVATISVVPKLPEPLKRLEELAYNLWWSWNHNAIALFRRVDRDLWISTGHNPVVILGRVSQARLDELVKDAAFMTEYRKVLDSFDAYMNRATPPWYEQHHSGKEQPRIAYFSMEFGITESLQNYSGGLGVLSGDHLKSASDLGLPLIGVGLLYQEGYFRQYLNDDGFQQERYPINDYSNLPVTIVTNGDGTPLKVRIMLGNQQLTAIVHRVQVGRVPLYLLDSNLPENPGELRNLTDRLYGGDRRTRIQQEILMGIGGMRALDAMGLRPDVVHMNEGHSAFMALERIRVFMKEHQVSFDEARTITSASSVFTTHTPVPAGLERFGFDLIDEHFAGYMQEVGISREQFMDLGRENMGTYELFSMAVLAINCSTAANGVAKLHGRVSRELWQWLYPQIPSREIPIGSVTNGVHTQTWISYDMGRLFDRYLDPAWRSEDWRPDVWAEVENIPDGELWRTHELRRERLIAFTRSRLISQLKRRGAAQSDLARAEEVLRPDALTIGFARRFATYKRATLLFRDIERIKRILLDEEHPVQIIFAGKAHPHDNQGKEFIRQLIHVARLPEFRNHVVFLEDYDLHMARYLVQGVDVWLNNPRRPKEASGTSGMKVIYNGGLNFSVLDGWWDEAYAPEVGWAIGHGEEYAEADSEQQDYIESAAIYNVLENDILPTFYERGRDSLPREWIGMMKQSYVRLAPVFNTSRMVQEYTDDYYLPVYQRSHHLVAPKLEVGLDYAHWREALSKGWPQVAVKSVQVPAEAVQVGATIETSARVVLGSLKPTDVVVQLYYSPLTSDGDLRDDGSWVNMELAGTQGDEYEFKATVICATSGDRGVSVRILPANPNLTSSFEPRLIRWA